MPPSDSCHTSQIRHNTEYGLRLSSKFFGGSGGTPQSARKCPSFLAAYDQQVFRQTKQTNAARKDNAFTSFDFRVSKRWKISEKMKLEGAIDTFNLFNSKNLKQPQNGNLLFNFDGTLTSGLGDPRQAQLGVKLLF